MEKANHLGPRLAAIARTVLRGQTAADIGADHALLSLYLLQNKIVPKIVAVEAAQGPFQRARKASVESSCGHLIDLRQGEGLGPLHPGEVDSVIIAGLGGDTIVEILSRDWLKSSSFKHYVLQPMSRTGAVRKALSVQGWPIEDEILIRDKDQIYVVITARPGNSPYLLTELELDVGPIIIKRGDSLAREYFRYWLVKYKAIVSGLGLSETSDNSDIIKSYLLKIQSLEEIRECQQG